MGDRIPNKIRCKNCQSFEQNKYDNRVGFCRKFGGLVRTNLQFETCWKPKGELHERHKHYSR